MSNSLLLFERSHLQQFIKELKSLESSFRFYWGHVRWQNDLDLTIARKDHLIILSLQMPSLLLIHLAGTAMDDCTLIETSISRDILMLTRIDKPALMKRLFELGCSYSGQILSYNKMIGQLHDAGNTTTLSHYLDLLNTAGLFTHLTIERCLFFFPGKHKM